MVPKDEVEQLSAEIPGSWGMSKVSAVVAGGEERQDSVWNALRMLEDQPDDRLIAIHDGVRPFITELELGTLIEKAEHFGAAIVGVRPKDTMKTVRDGFVRETLDRRTLLAVQTPQVFKKEIIIKAYRKAFDDRFYGTDDAMLVERLGRPVSVVEGSYRNIKITSPEDLLIAASFLRQEEEA